MKRSFGIVLILVVGFALAAFWRRANQAGDIGDGHTIGRSRMELNSIAMALNMYETTFGGFPTGSNGDIFRSLMGTNPKAIAFLEPGITNQLGELLDPWNSPYQIQIIANTSYLIRSAGKNRIAGDADDIALRSAGNANSK